MQMKNGYNPGIYPCENVYAASFALDDLALYLDTHPCDRAALEYYQKLRCEEASAQAHLAEGGYVMTAAEQKNTNRWTWVDGLWPWEGV